MDHIAVNASNFFVIGLSASLFIGGGLFILIWLANSSIPLLTPVAQVILGAIHKL